MQSGPSSATAAASILPARRSCRQRLPRSTRAGG